MMFFLTIVTAVLSLTVFSKMTLTETYVTGKPPSLVRYKYRKTLKISVFGCSEIYLVAFGFVAMTLKETLIFFDLQT